MMAQEIGLDTSFPFLAALRLYLYNQKEVKQIK